MSQADVAMANMKAAYQTDPLARGLILGAVSTIQKLSEMGLLPNMSIPTEQQQKEAQ